MNPNKTKLITINGKKRVVDANPMPEKKKEFFLTKKEINEYEKMLLVEKKDVQKKILKNIYKNVHVIPQCYTEGNSSGLDYSLIQKMNDKFLPKDRRKFLIDVATKKDGIENIMLILRQLDNITVKSMGWLYSLCKERQTLLLNKENIRSIPNLFLYSSIFAVPNIIEKFPFHETMDFLQIAIEFLCPELLVIPDTVQLLIDENQNFPKFEEIPSTENLPQYKEDKENEDDEDDEDDKSSNFQSYLITGALLVGGVILISYGLPPIISWFTSSSTKTS